jgi:hypothetical protein
MIDCIARCLQSFYYKGCYLDIIFDEEDSHTLIILFLVYGMQPWTGLKDRHAPEIVPVSGAAMGHPQKPVVR